MQLTRVDSSMIYAVGYDKETRTMDVVFNDSGVFRYFDVPEKVYKELLEADSKGSYMRGNVIDFYRFEKVRGQPRSAKPRK